jgi:hypothetical protein
VPGTGFHQVASFDQRFQVSLQLAPAHTVASLFALQRFQIRAAVRQLANVFEQGRRHDPLYW